MGLALVAEQPETAGQWLKRVRKEKGLTQKVLGDAIGNPNPEQYVSEVERGNFKPPAETCDAWAKKLGLPENELRRRFGHPDLLTSKEEADREILNYLEGASERGKEMMRAVLKTIYEVDSRQVAAGEQSEAKGDAKKARKWPRGGGGAKKDKANEK